MKSRARHCSRWKSDGSVAAGAKAAGFDSIIHQGPGSTGTHIVAFDPAQIKSAIGNRGTFDPANPDIRFSRTRQTDTPEFRRWFGDSKVVDADGKPLVVYHGTDAQFSAFDMGRARDGAHFFTPNESHAATFGNPGAYFLSISNPLEISQDDLDAAWDAEHPNGEQDDRNLLPRDFVPDFVRQAREGGYDGLIIRGMGDRDIWSDMYLPLSPTQIKSATGNRGTFDPADPDITMSRRRRVARRLGFDLEEATARPSWNTPDPSGDPPAPDLYNHQR